MLSADVLVVGGGIVGLMAAWDLAEAGADVVLVDARDFGTQASGANAGSIHLQIQYPEFVAYGEAWARAYAPSLRLLTESLRMWQALPARVGEDLDVKLAGGLVVATTDAQMRAIAAKARIEATVGVETVMLGREEIRALAPYLGRGRHRRRLLREGGQGQPAARHARHRGGGGARRGAADAQRRGDGARGGPGRLPRPHHGRGDPRGPRRQRGRRAGGADRGDAGRDASASTASRCR